MIPVSPSKNSHKSIHMLIQVWKIRGSFLEKAAVELKLARWIKVEWVGKMVGTGCRVRLENEMVQYF